MSCKTTKKTMDERFARELYEAGKDDSAIAACCRVKIQTVKEWRDREGLEKNTPLRVQRSGKHEVTQLEKDSVEARKQYLTYGQYKAQFYRPPVSAQKRRRIP